MFLNLSGVLGGVLSSQSWDTSILSVLCSYGEPFMEAVCRDACDGHDVGRVRHLPPSLPLPFPLSLPPSLSPSPSLPLSLSPSLPLSLSPSPQSFLFPLAFFFSSVSFFFLLSFPSFILSLDLSSSPFTLLSIHFLVPFSPSDVGLFSAGRHCAD